MKDNNEMKVRRGERVTIPAATWNNIVDASKKIKRTRFNPDLSINAGSLESLIKSNICVFVRNASNYDMEEGFCIMRLSGTIGDATVDKYLVNRRPAFDGFIPQRADDAIAILQAPLMLDDTTKGVISGITVCKVLMVDMQHEWCNPTPEEHRWMTSAPTGQARILWFGSLNESGLENIYVAVVHLIGVSGVVGSTSGGSEGISTGGSTGGSTGSGGDEGELVEADIVTNICPIFEDVTYEQAIDELLDLLSQLPGFDDGKVLGYVDGILQWIEPGGAVGSFTDTGITRLTGDVLAGPGSGTQTALIPDKTITYPKFQDIWALSVIGRTSATNGVPAAIEATANGQYLQRVNNTVVFAALKAADLTGTKIFAHSTGGGQSISNGVPTFILLDTEVEDALGEFTPVGSTIFTPAVTGVYFIDFRSSIGGGGATRIITDIRTQAGTVIKYFSDGDDILAGGPTIVSLTGGTQYRFVITGFTTGLTALGGIDKTNLLIRRFY